MCILATRIRFASFCQNQEEELGAIASSLVTDLQITTMVQCQSVWVCNRSQAFTEIVSAWDDWEWKKNFSISRATFRYLCNELHNKLRHESTFRDTVLVEKRVAIALWRLGMNVEYQTMSHEVGVGVPCSQVCLDTSVSLICEHYSGI